MLAKKQARMGLQRTIMESAVCILLAMKVEVKDSEPASAKAGMMGIFVGLSKATTALEAGREHARR